MSEINRNYNPSSLCYACFKDFLGDHAFLFESFSSSKETLREQLLECERCQCECKCHE